MKKSALIALVALVPAGAAFAVSPKYWIHDTAEELAAGDPDGVSILSDGSIGLAPGLDELAQLDVPYVWDVAATPDGKRVVLGTGDDGWVMEITGGKAVDFFQCAAFEVLSVTIDPEGRVFAGTAPEGFVYRIDAEGRGDVLFDAEEEYVWDLEFGPDGMLYAAVGTGGAVYRIDPESGDSERIFSTDDNHVVCLAFDDEGNLLLGTEGRGLVIRVNGRGKAEVLYDCPQGEVGAVLAGRDGVVWAAAAAAADVREDARRESSDQADGNGNGNDGDDFPDPFVFEVTLQDADEGVLYRVDANGNASRLWGSGQGAIFDLAHGPDGDVLAVTGEDGAVFSVDADGQATLILETREDQVVCLVPVGDEGYVFGTANPSRVYRMSAGARKEGTFTSDVLDAQRIATWGRVEWTGDERGGSVRIAARTGNTDEPDDTWSDWKELPAERSAPVDLPNARFFQWRAALKGGDGGPEVRRVRVSSLENNVAPLVTNVEIIPAGKRFYDELPEVRPRPLYQALPGGVNVQYQFDQGGDKEFPPEHRAPWTQGLRQVRWDSIDPNGDTLLFDLSFRREDEKRWKTFAEDVEGRNYTFNGNGMPDGIYRIRVTASDRRSNPGAEATRSAVSETFIVDNTAPGFDSVRHERDGDSVHIVGEVFDALSDVIRFEYSVNGKDWVDRGPVDGIFDSPREDIDVQVDAPAGKEHSVLLRGTDNAGNLGATRVLIRP